MSSPDDNGYSGLPSSSYPSIEIPNPDKESKPSISILRQPSSSSTISSNKPRISFSRSDSSSSKTSGHTATDVSSNPLTPSGKPFQGKSEKETHYTKRFSLNFGFFDSASNSSRTLNSSKSSESIPTALSIPSAPSDSDSIMHPHDDHHNEKKSSFHFSVFNTPRLTNPLPTTSPPEKPTSEKDKDKEPVKPATKNHRFSWSSTKSTKSSEPYRLSNLPQLITPVLTQQNLEKESGKEAFSSKRLSFPFSFFDPSASHDSRKTRGSLTIPNTPTTRTPTTPTPTPTTPTTPNLQQEPEKKHQELLHIELLIYKCHHSETIVKPMRDYTTYTMVPYMCTPCVEWLKRYGSKGKKDGASSRRKSIAF